MSSFEDMIRVTNHKQHFMGTIQEAHSRITDVPGRQLTLPVAIKKKVCLPTGLANPRQTRTHGPTHYAAKLEAKGSRRRARGINQAFTVTSSWWGTSKNLDHHESPGTMKSKSTQRTRSPAAGIE